MAKFKTVGYIGLNKNGKEYIALDKMALKDLPKNDKGMIFINLGDVRRGKDQSDESFEKVLSWKKKDAFVVSDE
jgi:hypothetical protein